MPALSRETASEYWALTCPGFKSSARRNAEAQLPRSRVMKRLPLLFLCAALAGCSTAIDRNAVDLQALSAAFVDPPDAHRPGAFWAWLNGDVTRESITRDLEEMKAKGMARAEIWDVEARNNTGGAFGIGPPFLIVAHSCRDQRCKNDRLPRLGLTRVAVPDRTCSNSGPHPDGVEVSAADPPNVKTLPALMPQL